jgi:hypothetical protein
MNLLGSTASWCDAAEPQLRLSNLTIAPLIAPRTSFESNMHKVR